MIFTAVGACPKCGAPVYAPSAWWGIMPPPSTPSCGCNPQTNLVTTGTSFTMDSIKKEIPMTPQQEPDAVAHELASKLSHSCMQRNHYEKIAKALLSQRNQGIREGLEMGAKIAELWNGTSCAGHDDNPCCHTRTANAIGERIRAQIEKVGKL